MHSIPIFSVIGWSDTGKTTLINKLIKLYKSKGLKAAAVKKTHEDVSPDKTGSDSWSYIQSGAAASGLAAPGGGSFVFPGFTWTVESLQRIFAGSDIIICEGLKLPGYPVIQTAGNLSRPEDLKGTSKEWSLVITDSPILAEKLSFMKIPTLTSAGIKSIPDLIIKLQP